MTFNTFQLHDISIWSASKEHDEVDSKNGNILVENQLQNFIEFETPWLCKRINALNWIYIEI